MANLGSATTPCRGNAVLAHSSLSTARRAAVVVDAPARMGQRCKAHSFFAEYSGPRTPDLDPRVPNRAWRAWRFEPTSHSRSNASMSEVRRSSGSRSASTTELAEGTASSSVRNAWLTMRSRTCGEPGGLRLTSLAPGTASFSQIAAMAAAALLSHTGPTSRIRMASLETAPPVRF